MKVFRTALFVIGCALLIASLVITSNHEGVVQTLLICLGVVFAILVAMGVLSKGKERWTTLRFAGLLLLGFSIIDFLSVGMLTALPALVLLVLSERKLTHHRTERSKHSTTT